MNKVRGQVGVVGEPSTERTTLSFLVVFVGVAVGGHGHS